MGQHPQKGIYGAGLTPVPMIASFSLNPASDLMNLMKLCTQCCGASRPADQGCSNTWIFSMSTAMLYKLLRGVAFAASM